MTGYRTGRDVPPPQVSWLDFPGKYTVGDLLRVMGRVTPVRDPRHDDGFDVEVVQSVAQEPEHQRLLGEVKASLDDLSIQQLQYVQALVSGMGKEING